MAGDPALFRPVRECGENLTLGTGGYGWGPTLSRSSAFSAGAALRVPFRSSLRASSGAKLWLASPSRDRRRTRLIASEQRRNDINILGKAGEQSHGEAQITHGDKSSRWCRRHDESGGSPV